MRGEPGALARLHADFAIRSRLWFRAPPFFRALRSRVAPFLRTFPFVRVWCPACGIGEEAAGVAIVLRECGLRDGTQIYATDADAPVIAEARTGMYDVADLRDAEQDYRAGGGVSDLAEYFSASGALASLRPDVLARIAFIQHDLGCDGSPNEFQFIVCRDVLIDCSPIYASRVFDLLHASLCRFGVLAIGRSENLRMHAHRAAYECIDAEGGLYRRNP
ncbi:MAG: CheR family methyltransferase [Polyangiales bacterium]